ncbi:MFS transporter [Halorubrum sp. DTA98]|uniref:MFS transporter n=1 Tax=Halorubrum sp. DTA98 TaxID=3402163 RepID=UPI003AABEF0C
MKLRRLADYDVLILVSLIWFLGKFVRYAFPPLFELLQATYGVSNTVIGGALSGLMVVYALMQFPSGVVADRIGAVRVVVAGATVSGLGALALVVDSPFPVLVAAMLVIGAGTGVHKTVAVRLIARVYPTRTGRALGAHDTLGAFGGVAAPTAVVVFLSAPPALAWLLDRLPGADWRGVFLLTGVAALVLAAAFGLRLRGRLPGESDGDRAREGDDEAARREPGVRDYVALFRDGRFTAFVLVTVGMSFAHNGLVAFLPLYLSRVSGLATATASLLYSLFFWVTFVQLVTGDLSDRVGRFPVMVATGGLAAAALWGIVLTPSAGPIVLGALIAAIGVGSHGFQPVRGAYLMEILPDWLAGGGLGVVRTVLMIAGAFAPGIVGIIADVFSFRVAFGLLAGALALAAVGAAALWVTE